MTKMQTVELVRTLSEFMSAAVKGEEIHLNSWVTRIDVIFQK